MEENVKSLRQDTENIANIIAKNSVKSKNEVLEDMRNRTNLNPEQAREYGLVHEIKNDLIPDDATIFQVD